MRNGGSIARHVRIASDRTPEVLEYLRRNTNLRFIMFARAYRQPGPDLTCHSSREIICRGIVHRHRNHSHGGAPQECRNPLRTVLSPEQDTLAFLDAS